MQETRKLYGASDVGCYVDGAFGHAHRRARLAELVADCGDTELVESLQGDMPDDAWDEDAAVDWLQEQTVDGYVWVSDCGDLCLCTEKEADENGFLG